MCFKHQILKLDGDKQRKETCPGDEVFQKSN